MSTMSNRRAYRGPALFSYGFRPFFLFGAIFAGLVIPLWLAVFGGEGSLPTSFLPRDWHVHEMLFGFVAAVVAGFLLTAVPNWTGRLPIQGWPLAVLFSVWLAGRLAVGFSASIGWASAAAIDVLFLAMLAAATAREIVAGRKWGNLKVVGIVMLLAATNAAFHLEAHVHGIAEYASRAGVALIVTLIGVIGGRIVPSFTRNWLARRAPGALPAPFGRFDAVTMAASGVALAVWIVTPSGRMTGVMLAFAGLLQLVRLARWAGYRTAADRLVLILHVAYAFIPAGFILTALAALDAVPLSAGIHAWTGGAMGTMTLAVMSRASLGHTGRPLAAPAMAQIAYAAVVLAALARICAAVSPDSSTVLLHVSALGWMIAFLGFAASYAPLLCCARKSEARP